MKKFLKKLLKSKEEEKELGIEDFVEEALDEDDMGLGLDSFGKAILALEHKVRKQGNVLSTVDRHADQILKAIKEVDDKLTTLTEKVESFEKRRFKKK